MNKYGKITAVLLYGLLMLGAAGAQEQSAPEQTAAQQPNVKGTVYISPNNSGVQDALEVPVKIKDKRYIREWSFIITNENGETVRTIGNKQRLPETASGVLKNMFKGKGLVEKFRSFKKAFAPRRGVEVPESVMWNGVLDSGSVAPDGTYYYYLTATDDNGNTSSTEKYCVVVDCVPPDIQLQQPSEASKIFGAGKKPFIKIEQSGSEEELWEGTVLSSSGKIVRTFSWKDSAPLSFEWDGKTDDGSPAENGVYTYKITATDRAGNTSAPAQITNIIYDAVPRSVNLAVSDSIFSPAGNSPRKTITIMPSMPNTSGLVRWEISVLSAETQASKTFSGGEEAPEPFEFNGTDADNKTLPDGDYKITFSAWFSNGQEAVISRNCTIDSTPPHIDVAEEDNIFAPGGDSLKSVMKISQTAASSEKEWTGSILNSAGNPIRVWSFTGMLPEEVLWDGITDSGTLAPDGEYSYQVTAIDAAGNTGSAKTSVFKLDTSKAEILLTLKPAAFSPNGSSTQNSVAIIPIVNAKSGVNKYSVKISDANGVCVKTYSGSASVPKQLVWDGRADDGSRCADGSYSVELEVVPNNDMQPHTAVQNCVIDTVPPELHMETMPYLVFSPNKDSKKDSIPFAFTTSEEDLWSGRIVNAAGKTVREYSWHGKAESFSWDGTDSQGNVVPDGIYRFVISATDAAGNKTEGSISGVTVDTRAAQIYVTAEYDSFSPNKGSIRTEQKFTVMPTLKDGVESWDFSIIAADGKTVVRQWTQKDQKDLPENVQWNGITADGKAADGVFTARLNVVYAKGDEAAAETAPFFCTAQAPQLTVRTAPEYFSPDNDGVDDDLFISLKGNSAVGLSSWSFQINDPQNGKSFWKISGKNSITERIIWDGRGNNGELVQSATDYPYVFTATDTLGLTSTVSGVISVDVLVIRIGDVLKMQIPSIIFRSDHADFVGKDKDPQNGLEQHVIANNNRVLKRVAEILNKFRDYKVTIEGHANNVSGTEDEEIADIVNGAKNIPLVPLSEARAEEVKKVLVKNGVSAARLTTVGRGGRQPVVSRADRENWWKNRRVEFILNK
ncbi:MAG: gliding motility-associated C-terminal domain-containing protein [Bacteroides sp.]|nr:gliding motility-associated C-terminal domain-containing protein [Prevotella sp.]MCM1407722.1 gliding motility-associated C-terminal domain-containing protein [Treponema brennaborense]MCM1469128.1 gliding motility-associated C-terminal domain-containing protein [Bacteroides sp.]